jgi:hypothetical protein
MRVPKSRPFARRFSDAKTYTAGTCAERALRRSGLPRQPPQVGARLFGKRAVRVTRDEQLQRRRRALLQCELIFFFDSRAGISRGRASANGFLCFVGGGDFGHEEVPFAKQMIRVGYKQYSSQRRRRNGNAASAANMLRPFHNSPIALVPIAGTKED